MSDERNGAKTAGANRFLRSRLTLCAGRGEINVSLGFYLGVGVFVLILVASVFTHHGERPLADQHANPIPAGPVPEQVTVVPGSNLYHAGASCPYLHGDAQPLSRAEAFRRGLAPCPYCLGNSSARLTPRLQLQLF